MKKSKLIETKTLFNLWRDWCEKSNIQNQYNVIGFGSRLSRVIKSAKLDYIEKKTNTKSISGYFIYMNKYKKQFVDDN